MWLIIITYRVQMTYYTNTCCRCKVRDNAALPPFPILECDSSVIAFNAFYRTVTVSSCSILDRFIENNDVKRSS